MNFWQFINQGGTVKVNGNYSVNSVTALANTRLPYPITGRIMWTNQHSESISWDLNGNPKDYANNDGLYLVPVSQMIQYFATSNTTLASANTYAQWQANNIIYLGGQ